MTINWISQWARRCASRLRAPLPRERRHPTLDSFPGGALDADLRRARTDLAAVRARFQDHR
ncbi:hypothetical protein [Mycolicibacterium palauense]|uniref:hypothetical protein n=1 Tax=Mycolicibacterium palauense TaxID=2034511 RepID=UPI001145999A|nr:hypothetical protein [Mycolicibacterium palauense]